MSLAGPPATSAARRPGLALLSISGCTLLVVGLVAAVNLAVPMLSASSLHPGASALLWIVDAYVVVFACLVIPGGAAGDRYGRKGALIAGLLAVAAGAIVCAAAPSVAVLLTGRILTGVGAALVLPNCVGVLVHATPPERRGRALAVWGTVSGLGGPVGNLGGGAILTGGSWRTLFWVVVPIAVSCAAWAGYAVPRSDRRTRPLDPAGSLLFAATVVALLTGVVEGPERGWASPVVLVAFALSVVLGAAWTGVGLRSVHPLLDPRLFGIPALSGAALGMMVTFFGSFGLFFLNASLLQYGRGWSVLQAGLGTLPLAVPLLIGSRLVPRLVRRAGIPLTLTAAFLTISAGLAGLSGAVRAPFLPYAIWSGVIGTGFALALPTLTADLTAALPAEQAGVAGGLQSATRELGSALGVAVVGTVLTSAFTAHLPAVLRQGEPVPRTVAAALAAAPAEHAAIVASFVAGAQLALRVAAVVTVVAGALVTTTAVTLRRRSARQQPRR
ncbi:major facilitator transporter [Actinoplanes sp. N902-109]|nr:major facilitator transporter [Actinoplanes sp. N902-109]